MKKLLGIAILALLALAQPARADYFLTLPWTGYTLHTNDDTTMDQPYMTVISNTLYMQPGTGVSSKVPGIETPYVKVGAADVGCTVSATGAIRYNAGFEGCYGTTYDKMVSLTTITNLLSVVAGKADTSALSAYVTTANYATGLATKPNTTSLSTVAFTGAYSDLSGKPTIPSALSFSFANPTRTLNTAFQLNATTGTLATYTVDVTINSLLTTVQGTVVLEYADNSGMSTNVVTVLTATSSIGGVLNIANTGTVTVGGMIPPGKWVRLRTVNTSGTPAFAYRSAQEVTF